MATTNGSTAIRGKILASLARYRALRIGKFPCAFWRLSSRPGLTALDVRLELVCEEVEIDEQWSFVGKKSNQRWLWHAVDHATNTVIAYVFGKRKDDVFKELKALLTPFEISRYYTDDWGAYERNLDVNEHEIGKQNTQKIERKNLNFRTWVKRLTRRTICFSKIEQMHDIVIGLLINKVEFGRDIHA